MGSAFSPVPISPTGAVDAISPYSQFSFRRMTDPLMVPIAPSATQFTVPEGFFTGKKYTSFCVVNPNNFWVRLRGSTGVFTPVTATTGWMFPPGFFGVFSTQFPQFMSCLSMNSQGLTAGSGFLEVSYGGGI